MHQRNAYDKRPWTISQILKLKFFLLFIYLKTFLLKKKKFSIYLITMEIQTVYITALPLLQNWGMHRKEVWGKKSSHTLKLSAFVQKHATGPHQGHQWKYICLYYALLKPRSYQVASFNVNIKWPFDAAYILLRKKKKKKEQ